MDQSASSKENSGTTRLVPPARTFTLEFIVGIFTILGCAAAAYLAVGLGGLQIGTSSRYNVIAEFDNISGLENGASVEIAGVPVGEVTKIYLNDPMARIVMNIDKHIKLSKEDIVAIRTKGIIGDRYVKISRGATDSMVEPGGVITETESVVDIEDLIGKLVHNMSSGDSKDKE